MGAFDLFVSGLGGAAFALAGVGFGVAMSGRLLGQCERWRQVFRGVPQ